MSVTILPSEASATVAVTSAQQTVVVDDDRDRARDTARNFAARYLGLVNYRNSLLREGWSESELDDGPLTHSQHQRVVTADRLLPHPGRVDVERLGMEMEGGERLGLRLENLSTGGACLSPAPADWRVRKPLRFVLGTEDKPELLRVSGAVRWRLGGLVGVAFDGAGPALRRRVHDALRELLPPAS